MKPDIRSIASTLALLLLLSGCGQKGPLFLPEDDDKAQTGLPSATPDSGTNDNGTNDHDTNDDGTKDDDTTDDDRTPPDEPTTDRDPQPPISNSQ